MGRSRRAKRVRVRRELTLLSLGVVLAGFSIAAWNGSTSLAREAASMMAAANVSITANVPPNEDNTLALALAEKEQHLAEREAAIGAGSSGTTEREGGVPWGLLSFLMSTVLFVLVAANFYLDMRRDGRRIISSPFAIDLRTRP